MRQQHTGKLAKLISGAATVTAAFIAVAAGSEPAHAWSHHALVTHQALKEVRGLDHASVQVTSFEELLSKLDLPGVQNALEFNRALQIHKGYRFELRFGDSSGAVVPAIDVLSNYSDEPDWGMDQNLFASDQYPELWKDDYQMMGGRQGIASQAFRHMYWEALDPLQPVKTFKLPASEIFKSMGQAPLRADAFVRLSRKAREAGQTYWSLRFLACALHYLEDLSQPYHATQTATKKFLSMPFTEKHGGNFTAFVAQVSHLVAYYHFAFEDYVSQLMVKRLDHVERLENALSQVTHDIPHDLEYAPGGAAHQVRVMAKYAVKKAPLSAKSSIRFFPPLEADFATVDLSKYFTEAWWKEVYKRAEGESDAKSDYLGAVAQMFEPMGFAVRSIVEAEALR